MVQREKKQVKIVGLRVATLNVRAMTGKGRELAVMMPRIEGRHIMCPKDQVDWQ